MSARMNLLRDFGARPARDSAQQRLAVTGKRSLKLPSLPKLSGFPGMPARLSPRGAVALGLVTMTILILIVQSRRREARVVEYEARARDLEATIQRLTEAAAARRLPTGDVPAPQPLDGTWTSLLWKLAVNTGSDIFLKRMEMLVPGSAPGTIPDSARRKSVVMEGQARSVAALRGWMERLVTGVPGYDFSMDSQAKVDDQEFPVGFRMTVIAL